jgi:hypothetical protein
VLLTGNGKRLCDTFVSVHAMTKCKNGDIVEHVHEELQYVLNEFC